MCSAMVAGLFLGAFFCSGIGYLLVRSLIPAPPSAASTSGQPSNNGGGGTSNQRKTSARTQAPPHDGAIAEEAITKDYNAIARAAITVRRRKLPARSGTPCDRRNLSGDIACGLVVLMCGAASCAGGSTAVASPNNITTLLNELLQGYDSRLRPNYGGPATVVMADMNIRSMGPISEVDMSYSMDAYFRQTWSDRRLQFEGPIGEMAVHIKMLERIWKPDTYFYNGRGSYLHTTTTPNKLLRIKQDGTVLYSMRLTIKASCPMYLHYFPVDEQLCPLQFGSYAYTDGELAYVWKHGSHRSIKISKDMRMSQFDLQGLPIGNNLTVRNRSGEFSTLSVSFRLQRHMGYFMIQVYVPCTLIVILSWVSFWINREATADRVGLGITTVLTLTTVSLDSRDDLPKVSYATALDWFILMCYGFVIASLLEFAGVHYFTKIGSGEIRHDSDSEEESLEHDDDVYYNQVQQQNNEKYFMNNYNHVPSLLHNHHHHDHLNRHNHVMNTSNTTMGQHVSPISNNSQPAESCLKKFLRCIQGNASYRKLMMKRSQLSGVNSVSMIDKVSRVLFPLAFTGLNVMYWIAYTR